MKNIGIILSAIFIPSGIMFLFSAIKKSNSESNKAMSDKYFIVMPSKIVMIIGAVLDFMIMVLLGFTIFSKELPHIIFYIIIGLFLWLGTYLILKALKFRVIVSDEEITVCSVIAKSYSFTFSDIVSAVRQVKRNQVKSERIVIKTESGRRLIVESAEISYKRFSQRIKLEVKSEYLIGFE